jgi:alkane 1-monooxygenase
MGALRVWPFTLCYGFTGTAFVAVWLGGAWAGLTPAVLFLLFPVLDFVLGQDRSGESLDAPNGWVFRSILYFYVPVHCFLPLWGAYQVSHEPVGWAELLLIATSVGFVSGVSGINIAHELCHKTTAWERFLGKLMLLFVCYMQFYPEHILIHHVHYGTPKDPTSSFKGESFYSYFPRAVRGKFLDTWPYECARLAKKGRGRWSLHNQILWFVALPLAVIAALYLFWGVRAATFFVVQSFLAILILEQVTYGQHYGLRRKETAPGQYEKGSTVHSWDSYYRLSNYLLFQLPRHSDHHLHTHRRYQLLEAHEDSPRFPYAYSIMVPLALIPFLWRRVMDPRLDAFERARAQTS